MKRFNKKGWRIIGYKGGGGGASSGSGLDPEVKGKYLSAINTAENRFNQGPSTTDRVRAGYAEDAIRGVGDFDRRAANERALSNVAGQSLAGRSAGGSLTSARGDRAMQAALADRAAADQQQRIQDINYGVEARGQAEEGNVDRYFGRLANLQGAFQKSQSSQKQGK